MTSSPAQDMRTAEAGFLRAAERLPVLWRLSEEFNNLIALLEDPEADPVEVEAEMQRVAGDIRVKAGGVAVVIRALEGLSEFQKAEGQRLSAKAKATQGHADRLRDYAKRCLAEIGEERIETGTFTLAIRVNPPSVEVLDAAAVPNEYQRTKIEVSVDKRAILEAFKKDGEIVPGTQVVRTDRLEIR